MIQNKTHSKNQLGLTLLYSLGIFLFGSIKTKELVYVGSFFLTCWLKDHYFC